MTEFQPPIGAVPLMNADRGLPLPQRYCPTATRPACSAASGSRCSPPNCWHLRRSARTRARLTSPGAWRCGVPALACSTLRTAAQYCRRRRASAAADRADARQRADLRRRTRPPPNDHAACHRPRPYSIAFLEIQHELYGTRQGHAVWHRQTRPSRSRVGAPGLRRRYCRHCAGGA
jgi:hypothetical protein